MAKDPAFLFYPNDYLGGTMGMTFEEKGAYMELLMMQFNRGHMTTHMIGQTVGQLWDKLSEKFIQDDKGLWFNARLEQEQNKRKAFTDSRKNNVVGTNQYTKKTGHTTTHMTGHMEDENKDVNNGVSIIKELPKKFQKPTIQEVFEYCAERKNGILANQFIDFYESKGWKVGNQAMKDWKAAVRTWENKKLETKPTHEKIQNFR